MNRKNIPILTSVRFFAALAVVIAHYEKNQLIFPLCLTNLGGPAVTFFFILSGFVLTYAHVERNSAKSPMNVSTKDFLILRMARILPAYLIGLVLAFPILCYGYFHLKTIGSLSFFTSLLLDPLFLQAWFPAAFVWNPPSWSLSVEWLFYILFPFVIGYLTKISKRKLLISTYLLVLSFCVIKTIITIVFSDVIKGSIYWYNFIHYFPPPFVPIFVLGISLALFSFETKKQKYQYDIFFWLGVSSIILIVIFKDYLSLVANIFFITSFATFIYGSTVSTNWLTDLLSKKVFLILGESSYALYIIHSPLSRWWKLVVDKFYPENLTPWIDFCGYLCLCLCLCLSIAIFYFIEAPGRKWIRKRFI